jgi:hypothetical protein
VEGEAQKGVDDCVVFGEVGVGAGLDGAEDVSEAAVASLA